MAEPHQGGKANWEGLKVLKMAVVCYKEGHNLSHRTRFSLRMQVNSGFTRIDAIDGKPFTPFIFAIR